MEQTASSMSVNLSVTEKYNTNNLASNSSYQWSELEAGLLSTRSIIAATNVSPEEEGVPTQANLPIEVILNGNPSSSPSNDPKQPNTPKQQVGAADLCGPRV